MKTSARLFVLALISLLFLVIPSWAAELYEYEGMIPEGSPGARILREFVDGMDPLEVEMILSQEPDASGHVNRIFMNLRRPLIGGVRLDNISFEALDVHFNPVREWASNPVEVQDMLAVYAQGTLLEDDINNSLRNREFGGDEHWHDLALDFRSSSIYAKGYYLAKFIFRLDILIEISGELSIVRKQQIWLDNYNLRVNRVNVPENITDRAISKIQPILDLSRFIFPLELNSIEMDENKIQLRSRYLPQRFEGITYHYIRKEVEEKP